MAYICSCMSEFGGELFGSFFRIIGDDYFAAFGDNAVRGCFANTTGSTGDDNYFIIESVHI